MRYRVWGFDIKALVETEIELEAPSVQAAIALARSRNVRPLGVEEALPAAATPAPMAQAPVRRTFAQWLGHTIARRPLQALGVVALAGTTCLTAWIPQVSLAAGSLLFIVAVLAVFASDLRDVVARVCGVRSDSAVRRWLAVGWTALIGVWLMFAGWLGAVLGRNH